MKKHIWILALAIVVGVIYAGPDIYHSLTPGYQGIIMADAGDSDYYLTVINKSYQSQGFVRDPFHYEYQNVGNPFQYFPVEFALGKIGAILHLRLDILAILVEFVCTALLTILMYILAFKLSSDRLTSYTIAAIMVVGTELVHPNGLHNLVNTFLLKGEFSNFLLYSRPVNPQTSGLFFFAALLSLLNFFYNRTSKRAIILAGFSVGLLAYIYPYFWAFAFTLLGVIGIYGLVTRNWRFILAVFYSVVACIATMAPFLLANLSVFIHGGSNALTQTIPTHRIIVEKVILLPLIMYVLIFLWGRFSTSTLGVWCAYFAHKYLFVTLLLVTGVIVSNQQVLTGKLMFQEHFHFFTNIPLFALSMTLLAMELLALTPKSCRVFGAGFVVVLCVWFAVGVQVASYKAHEQESAHYQELAPIFAYLNTQPHQKVIFANYYLSTRLTMYTQDFTYAGGYDTTFAVPQQQLAHDYFVMLTLRGITAEQVRPYLYEHRDEVGSLLFIGTYWRDLCGSYGCFPDEILDALVPQYEDFMSHLLSQTIHTHKIDYLLWDSKLEPEWQLKSIVKNPPVYESGDFKLYEIL